MVGKLLEFAEGYEKYNNTYIILKDEPHVLPLDSSAEENSEIIEDGYVYLMQFGNEYKIGTSNNVERRRRAC